MCTYLSGKRRAFRVLPSISYCRHVVALLNVTSKFVQSSKPLYTFNNVKVYSGNYQNIQHVKKNQLNSKIVAF